MQLTPYAELIKMGKEKINEALAPVRAKSAKKKAELEESKLEERIATLEMDLNTLCAEKELNFDRIIDKLDEIDLADRRRKQMKKILSEMFPEVEKTVVEH